MQSNLFSSKLGHFFPIFKNTYERPNLLTLHWLRDWRSKKVQEDNVEVNLVSGRFISGFQQKEK